jgi:hypothetical protein
MTRTRIRSGSKVKMGGRTMKRRRWACPKGGCTQDRITPLDTARAPICPEHSVAMTKRRQVVRRRGF